MQVDCFLERLEPRRQHPTIPKGEQRSAEQQQRVRMPEHKQQELSQNQKQPK